MACKGALYEVYRIVLLLRKGEIGVVEAENRRPVSGLAALEGTASNMRDEGL